MNFNINIDKIKNFMEAHNLSKSKFCNLAKINISTFNNILYGNNFRVRALFKIARIMNIQVYELFL